MAIAAEILENEFPFPDDVAQPRSTPLAKMLAAFPDAKQRPNGWWMHPDNPTFDFLETEKGDILLHSWTGREAESILSMGKIPLTRADLFARPGIWSQVQHRDKIDLLTLAHHMKIDLPFLESIGYSDGYHYVNREGSRTTCVKIGGYSSPDGQPHTKNKVRLSIHDGLRFLWDQNTPGDPIPCGLHRINDGRQAGYHVIGEGESDAATMWFHGLPFLGIPGANLVKYLDVELLAGIPCIYILEEPDQAKKLQRTGQAFYSDVRTHLRANGYGGQIFSIRFEEATGYKDPSDLHKAVYRERSEQAEGPFREAVHARFIEAMEAALATAIPEGNDTLGESSSSEPPKKNAQAIEYEEYSKQLMSVPASILSPAQKLILLYFFLYLRDVTSDAALGWQLDTDEIARAVGMSKKAFLGHLKYLADTVGLFTKEHKVVREFADGQEPKFMGTELYVTPNPAFYQPRGYAVPQSEERAHGGSRTPNPKCENCGSENTRPFVVIECLDCGHSKYPPIDPEPENTVDSTASVLEDEQQKEESPETPKLGISGNQDGHTHQDEEFPEIPNLGSSGRQKNTTYIDSDTQDGVFGTNFELFTDIPKMGTSGKQSFSPRHARQTAADFLAELQRLSESRTPEEEEASRLRTERDFETMAALKAQQPIQTFMAYMTKVPRLKDKPEFTVINRPDTGKNGRMPRAEYIDLVTTCFHSEDQVKHAWALKEIENRLKGALS